MMPHWPSVLFLFAAGTGLLAVAYHGYRVGEVRVGANFWRGVYRPTREDNPLAFHFFLVLYVCSGLSLCVGAARTAGHDARSQVVTMARRNPSMSGGI